MSKFKNEDAKKDYYEELEHFISVPFIVKKRLLVEICINRGYDCTDYLTKFNNLFPSAVANDYKKFLLEKVNN